MIAIRPATEDDLRPITDLEEQAFPNPWRYAFFQGELLADRRLCLVAYDEAGVLAGYVFAMYYLDEMHINKIATRTDLRRSGVASMLMEECRRFAVAHDVRTFSLEVRLSNEAAQAFYRRLNFHPVYTRRNYYPDGEGAVVMMAAVT